MKNEKEWKIHPDTLPSAILQTSVEGNLRVGPLFPRSIVALHNYFRRSRHDLVLQMGSLVSEIRVVDYVLADLPNVVVEEERQGIRICASKRWSKLGDLAKLFVSILSHESIHLALARNVDPDSSEQLDEIASFSTISTRLSDIRLVKRFAHGLIGIETL